VVELLSFPLALHVVSFIPELPVSVFQGQQALAKVGVSGSGTTGGQTSKGPESRSVALAKKWRRGVNGTWTRLKNLCAERQNWGCFDERHSTKDR